ncbi:MAG: hypothetical protein JXK07_03580 [Spirochaetes bacterium]|nr:hypothetical protein [Spirochaetota bacterium]MBN2770656.1 hypothetical protein [Spirochaetota bacterium]
MKINKKASLILIMICVMTLSLFISYEGNPPRLGIRNLYAQRKATFALNINDQDINEFLKMMSSLIGKNIIADNKVRGKITVISAKRIPVSEAYNIMKSILQLQGFAVIESENLIKIVTIDDAISSNTTLLVDEDLNVSTREGDTITYIYNVKEGDAYKIRNILNTLKSRTTKVLSYEDLNYILLSGMASEIEGLIKVAEALDKAPASSEEEGDESISKGNIHVVHLQYANAKELAEVLSRVPFSETAKINTEPRKSPEPPSKTARTSRAAAAATRQPAPSSQQPKFSIIANNDTNSLIITATTEEFRQIKAIISQLDIVREQVLIEALVIEVSAENGWGFGIDWMLGAPVGQRGSDTGGLIGGSQIFNSNSANFTDKKIAGKDVVLPLNQGFQLGFLSDRAQLGFMLLNAQATDKNFSILSTPQIMTVDNQEAEINVGDQFPVPSNNIVNSDGTSSFSYDYKDAGLKLKITPHITKGGKVTLQLYQEVNSVKSAGTTLSNTYIPPDISKRDIKTIVSVDDGKTVVVGGLINNNKSESETKVPILGDIPVLGWLFKYKEVKYTKTNLLVFITPHIVTDADKLHRITQEKKEEQKLLNR